MKAVGGGIRVGSKVYTEGWGSRYHPPKTRTEESRRADNRESSRRYAAKHPDKVRENQRRCVPPLRELIPGYEPKNAAKIPPPPCGRDCRNCPHDDGCAYEDWDEEHGRYRITKSGKRQNRATLALCNARYRERLRERRAADPKLDARVKEQNRRASAKRRAKIKWVKAGGSLEEFERTWTNGKETM